MSKHRLLPYNAHYLNYNFLLSFWFQYLMNVRFKIIFRYIRHIALIIDFDHSGSQNPEPILMKLGMVDYVRDPPHMTTSVGVAQRGWS